MVRRAQLCSEGPLLELFEAARQLIVEFPNAGAPHLFKTRSRLLEPFPCYVVYVLRGERPLIVALAHTSRRPGYWRDRLQSE